MRTAQRALLIGAATAVSVTAAMLAPQGAVAAPKTPTGTAAATAHNVIVLLRDQHPSSGTTRGQSSPRAKALRSDQTTVAQRHGVARKTDYSSINAFATRVDASQVRSLQADPSVAAVVPDLPVSRPVTQNYPGNNPSAGTVNGKYCPTDPSKPILEPEALQTMNVAFDDGRPGAQNITTGKGVKVAWLADGIDTNNQDFIRADGSKVFVDYQDFTGEGPDAPSSAAEAFGDASAIAAQGLHTYDLSTQVVPAHPLPKGCNITVRGVAPGASMVGIKVFGEAPTAPTSRFIGAIDYAVNVDKVDVINESFGANPFPDTMDDPISLVNNAAIAAGVTVVASTGDAGTSSTIGSPATSSGVIAVAATTTYRLYAQTTAEGYQFAKSWANDNISGLSSGGFAQNGKIPDVAAPGDLGWALCSTNTAIYESCLDANNKPSPLIQFGGTSQSSPLTAGTAALVIAAYRDTHGGASPSPALVKSLITSTARDLGHAASEQGAGIVNALAAVKAARSVPTSGRDLPGTADGASLLLDKTQLNLDAAAGDAMAGTVTVRNLSKVTRTVTATTRIIGSPVTTDAGTLNVNLAAAGTPTFVDELGRVRGYQIKEFTVKPGADRLDVSTAFQVAPAGSLARFFLIDPKGVYQSYSIPQGAANYARSAVRFPAAGTWKMYFQSGVVPASIAFNGPVAYKITTSKFENVGSVSPASRTLAPGQKGSFTVAVPAGKQVGDRAASIQLHSAGHVTSVPMSLRTNIPMPATGKKRVTFDGVITGGNGRTNSPAQTNSYYLDVPRGTSNLNIGVRLDNQPAPDEEYYAYLVDPNGQPLSAQTNLRVSETGDAYAQGAIQLYRAAPTVGRWTLIIEAANPVAGTRVEQPFTGIVSFAAPKVTAKGLPNDESVKVPAGQSTVVAVKVTNNGIAPLTYFTDARLGQTVQYKLASQIPGNDLSAVDLYETQFNPTWLVPSRSTSVTYSATATKPIGIDASWYYGDPEIYNSNGTNKASVSLSAPQVAPGPWYAGVGELGPFSAPSDGGTVAYTATVQTQAFDPAVTSSTGDYWITSLIPAPGDSATPSTTAVAPSVRHWSAAMKARATESRTTATQADDITDGPLTLSPGETGYILVAVTPDEADAGRVVRGTLNIGTVDPALGTGDEVASLPYSYTVGGSDS